MVVKLYQPYTHFPRNLRLSLRRIAAFLINAYYKYSYLFTDEYEFLVDKYLWLFYATMFKLNLY